MRTSWIVVDTEGTKHQRRTWQEWSLVEQAGHQLGKKQAETLDAGGISIGVGAEVLLDGGILQRSGMETI
jgi:hypothetical protein